MKLWPNRLGCDIGDAEVWFHRDSFRVFTNGKVLRILYTITKDADVAVVLCNRHGLVSAELEDLEPWEAQRLYLESAPLQKELQFFS